MKIGDYQFRGPFDPNLVFKEDFAAVYAILNDSNELVDVGETGSVNNRLPNHDRKLSWTKYGGRNLYVLTMPRENDRLFIEASIRRTYNPPCGDR